MNLRKPCVFSLLAFCSIASSQSALAREKVFRCEQTDAWYSYKHSIIKSHSAQLTPGVIVLNSNKKIATISGASVFLANTPERYILSGTNNSNNRIVFSIWKRDNSYSWLSISEADGNISSIGSASGRCRPL